MVLGRSAAGLRPRHSHINVTPGEMGNNYLVSFNENAGGLSLMTEIDTHVTVGSLDRIV